jgi:sugar (pentulose or hexulose) kinase
MLGAELSHYSLANRTILFDIEKEDWSDELLHWAGLDRQKLPPTVPSGQVIGAVPRVRADELGLPLGIPIISGAHDQCCNSVGCGSIAPGAALYGMGTQLCMTPVFSARPDSTLMIERGLNTEHHAVPGQFVSFIYNQGGVLVKWFRDTFAHAERLQAAEAGSLYPPCFPRCRTDLPASGAAHSPPPGLQTSSTTQAVDRRSQTETTRRDRKASWKLLRSTCASVLRASWNRHRIQEFYAAGGSI